MSVLSSDRNPNDENLNLFEFTNGIDLDSHLYEQEILVQKAWIHGLNKIQKISDEEKSFLLKIYDEILVKMEDGTFPWRVEDEDIHMNIERYITEKDKNIGKKIHLGRSRNDLIASTLKLYTRDQISNIKDQLRMFVDAALDHCYDYIDIIIPGLTHLQNGQPIRYSHAILSHVCAFVRDHQVLSDVSKYTRESLPLGGAALAGTDLSKIDLSDLSEMLDFENPVLNSYDAVSDRDFILRTLDAFSIIGMHMSRLAEDIIIWSSAPWKLIDLPAHLSTGSSIMPNKRNPDVMELIRAKSAQLIGFANSAKVLCKGLPTSYASDLHELKRVYISSITQLKACLEILPPFIRTMKANEKRADVLLSEGHILATEIANQMAENGIPFREAYGNVATLVAIAGENEKQVHELSKEEIEAVLPGLKIRLDEISFESSVERRNNFGGTARKRVLQSMDLIRKKIFEISKS